MRCLISVLAIALPLGAAGASAILPASGAAAIVGSDGFATAIHHKPGHGGGPPWARGRERQQDRPDGERDFHRDTERRLSYPRQVCRTTYREVYDRYEDVYVTRPVRVCRSDD